jgi:hypothetical protein
VVVSDSKPKFGLGSLQFSLEDSRLDLCLMALVPETTNGATPTPGEPFVFPSYRNIGPPYIATLSLPGLKIGLPVWLFSTLVISNVESASYVSTPPTHQPHVDLSPSSPVKALNQVARLIRRRRNGKRGRRRTKKGPNLQLHQMLDPSNQL